MTDTHALAARIEAAIHDVGRYNSDENITTALAALADYKRRVSELEAFVGKVASRADDCESLMNMAEYPSEERDAMWAASDALRTTGEKARALLASEVGDGLEET